MLFRSKKLKVGPEGEKFLRDPDCSGGSLIVAPDSHIIAGPMGAEEGILYAECALEAGILMKLRHDFAGHYNRADIFQLHVNRSTPHLYTVHEAEESDGVVSEAPTAPPAEETNGAEAESPPQVARISAARKGKGKS